MPTTLRIKRRSAGGGSSGPSTLAASELAFNETSGSRILYYGLGNDGYGTATSVIAIGGPDFNSPITLTGVITSNSSGVTTITSQTGTGSKFVVDTSPVLITPNIGTPSAGILTSCTGLPISTGVSGLATGAATFLQTPTSANLAALLTDETGTGANVFANSCTLVTPTLGAATATTINKITITQPTNGATLTLSDGVTLSVPSTGSISGTNTGDNATNSQYSSLITNQTHTGDATGSTALTVVRINGQSLAALATGLLKNTTSTGVPTIAVAGTDYIVPGGVLGTPSSGTLTNCTFPILNQSTTGNAATVTTNANLTGVITSIGNATSIASQTGTGTKFVMDTSPTLVTPNIGVATGTSLVLSGNLTVNGTTVSLNATNLEIVDKNIILGNAASPSEITCDGGGITLKSSTSDHTFNYVASTTSWTSSENLNLASGKTLKIAGTTILSATAIYGVDIDGGSF